MEHTYYNSWLSYFKKPFGSLKKGETADFTIYVPTNAAVQLFIHHEGSTLGQEVYQMEEVAKHHFHFPYRLADGKGLYFYYFQISEEIEHGKKIYYYGAREDLGGEGQIYGTQDEVMPYQLTCFEKDDAPLEWYRDSIFYQIFPDRFFNGNPAKNVDSPKPDTFIYGRTTDEPYYVKNAAGEIVRWDFYGGNLLGIQKKLDYLESLGVNALYLNPIFKAKSSHRYDTEDYLQIDEVLGTEGDFARLLEEAHKRGMHVILDGVFSHVGRNSVYFNYSGEYGKDVGAYQNPESPYYEWFTFTKYPDDYRSWWGVKDLPEIKKENRAYQEFIYGDVGSVLAKWNEMGIDGWRLDVADELPDEFIQGLRHNLDSYNEKVLIGEVWEDASKKISYGKRRQYILGDMLQGVMNYPFRDLILQLLQFNQEPKMIAEKFMTLSENYPHNIFFNNLNNIGTHDTERIASLLGTPEKVNLAVGMMFMLPGIPCVYYGDEAGLTGGRDPENRKFFPWGDLDSQYYKIFEKWIRTRKEYAALRSGSFSPFYTNELFGICRTVSEEAFAIYFLNPTGTVQTVHATEMTFAGESPLPEQVLAQLVTGIRIPPYDGYFIAREDDITIRLS